MEDALLRLVAAPGPAEPVRSLLETFDDAGDALAAGVATWRAHGMPQAQCAAVAEPDRTVLARGEAWLARAGNRLIGWRDPDYPALLRASPGAPVALFVAGDAMRLWHPAVAIVGSRAPTEGGVEHATAFARAFARAGLGVTSGLAAGIDTAAHQGALVAGGLTVAVLGTGPDVAYPRRNAALLERIAAEGAVVSEHPPGTPAMREHFPSRNRIVAGLTLGTLVVEAAHRSGALITARHAAEAGRDVMAIPGSIRNAKARGCHRLIREGAVLVEEPGHVLEVLAPLAQALAGSLRSLLAVEWNVTAVPEPGGGGAAGAAATRVAASADYKRLWQAIGHDPTDMDILVSRTGLTAADVASMLLLMELEGRVVSEHGRYTRKAS